MKIDGYEIVINVLSDNITFDKAIGRMGHDMREPKQTKKIKYLRGNVIDNKYFVQNDFGSLQTVSSSSNMTHDGIEKKLKSILAKFKADYERQGITDKNGKSKKRSWQKKMTPFTEILLTFGTQRPKEEKEGLNDRESSFINGLDITAKAMDFIGRYCKKYGVECIAAAEHNDEKTKHWQIIFTNYDFDKHACIRRSRGDMGAYGIEIQDMGADAFCGIAVRGVRGSKAVHKPLKQMHATEKAYKSEQEFKKSIQKDVYKNISKFISVEKSIFKGEYYKIGPENLSKLTSVISSMMFEKSRENISIVSDIALKEQNELLVNQLTDKAEVLSENQKLKSKNEALIKENLELEKQNEAFKDKNIVLSQKEEIEKLKESLGQKDVFIAKLENERSDNERIVNQAKKDKKELRRLESIVAEKSDLESKIQKMEQENSELQDQIVEQEKQNILISELEEEKNSLNMKLNKASGDKVKLEEKNELLIKENDILRQENMSLKEFKRKVINFFKNFMDKVSVIKSFIENEVPNIKSEVAKGEFSETRIS